jgi:hypothetical protein
LARSEISLAGQINQAHRLLDVARDQPAFEIELSQHDAMSQLARRKRGAATHRFIADIIRREPQADFAGIGRPDSDSPGCTTSRTPVDRTGIHCVVRTAMTPSAMAPPMMKSVRDRRPTFAGIVGGLTIVVPRAARSPRAALVALAAAFVQ